MRDEDTTKAPAGASSQAIIVKMQGGACYFQAGELHYHGCPECYEAKPCTLPCSACPDLDDDDSSPRGSFCVCNECRREAQP